MSLAEQLSYVSVYPDRREDVFYDWFCRDASLSRKAAGLFAKVQRIADSPRFDKNAVYVFFKNNCPCNGSLYDDFRICDLKTGQVLFCVVPRSGHDVFGGECQVYAAPDFENSQLHKGATWKDAVRYLSSPSEHEAVNQARLTAELLIQQRAEEQATRDSGLCLC